MSDGEFDLYRRNISPEVIGIIPASVAWECWLVPIECHEDGRLVVAAVDHDSDTLEKLRFILNRSISIVLATRQAIEYALNRYYPPS